MMNARRTFGSLLLIAAMPFAALPAACGNDDDSPVQPGSPRDAGSAIRDASQGPPDAATAAGDASITFDAGSAAECDPVEQNCTTANTKCVVDIGSGPACVPSTNEDAARAEPCEPGRCQSGLACVRLTDTATQSHCEKVCNLGTGVGCDALGTDFECRARIEGTAWGACQQLATACDPVTQMPCPDDEACQPFLRRTGAWDFRCRLAGPGDEADRCDGANPGCARGLACVSAPNGEANCRTICQTNDDCLAPAQCAGLVEEPPFSYCAG